MTDHRTVEQWERRVAILRRRIASLERELAAIDDARHRRPFQRGKWLRADAIDHLMSMIEACVSDDDE